MKTAFRMLAALSLLVALGSPSEAVVVTFDEADLPGINPIITSYTALGFSFTSGHMHQNDPPCQSSFGGCADNGTRYLAEEAGSLGLPITMALIGGGAFDLFAFDGAEVFRDAAAAAAGGFPNATHIDLVGNLLGGGMVSASFQLDGIIDGPGALADFQAFLLPATFRNLTSVVFSGSIVGAGPGGISIDNVSADEAAAVPEPGTLALVGVGLAGLARSRRRRRG